MILPRALAIDGVPLSELSLAWWRSQIAVVSQQVYLFNASVAENIAYGKLDATRQEIAEGARKAHALEWKLPYGFETILGDQGIRPPGVSVKGWRWHARLYEIHRS